MCVGSCNAYEPTRMSICCGLYAVAAPWSDPLWERKTKTKDLTRFSRGRAPGGLGWGGGRENNPTCPIFHSKASLSKQTVVTLQWTQPGGLVSYCSSSRSTLRHTSLSFRTPLRAVPPAFSSVVLFFMYSPFLSPMGFKMGTIQSNFTHLHTNKHDNLAFVSNRG